MVPLIKLWLITYLCVSFVSGQCNSPPNIPSGSQIVNWACYGSPTSTLCIPSCQQDWHIYGFVNVTCQGSTWSQAGDCCPTLTAPTNGVATAAPTTPTVTYTCNLGFTRSSGPDTVNCVNGTWDNTAAVTCTPITCPTLSSPIKDCSSTTYSSTCPVVCVDGYGLTAVGLQQKTTTCQASGSWDVPPASSVCTLCPANTYSNSSSQCAPCNGNATSAAGSTSCICNSGFIGSGVVCVANDTSGLVNPELVVTLKLNVGDLTDDVIRSQLPVDVARALNLTSSQVAVQSITHPDSSTAYVTIKITLMSNDPRSIVEVAAELQEQVQDPNSAFYRGTVSSHVDPHFFAYQIYQNILFNFRRLSSIQILVILIVLLVITFLCYLCNRKFFPSAHNTRLVALVLGLIAFGTNLNFVGFVYVYFFPSKMMEFYLSGGGIAISLVLNLFLVSYFINHERRNNYQFNAWFKNHRLATCIICVLSMANTKHTCLINSEILSIEALSAPISSYGFVWLQFLAVVTMLCCEVPCLIAQIRIVQFLGSYDNDATIGIIFNSISLLFGFLLCFVTGFLVSTPSPEGYDNDAPMKKKQKEVDPHFELELDDQKQQKEGDQKASPKSKNSNDSDNESRNESSKPKMPEMIDDNDQDSVNEGDDERGGKGAAAAATPSRRKRQGTELTDAEPTEPPPPVPSSAEVSVNKGYESD